MFGDDAEDRSDHTIIITDKVDLKEKSSQADPYLIQISGRETGMMHKISGDKMKIGRDATSQIILDDPHVSRNHAELHIKNGREITLKDLGSTNGVFVNGKKVTETTLADGDKVLIGTRLYFKFCYQDSVDQNYQQSLFRAANIDSLTQLYNKKYFVDALSKEFSFSKRTNQPLSLMMMDIDFFKKINDTYGHMAGDLVLKTVGQFLGKNIRLENIACRYGGEEFSIILRNVEGERALQIAERVRTSIEAETIVFRDQNIKITISVGIATLLNNNFETIDDFIQKADEHLYEAKHTGRNRVIMKMAA
ncbi:MAG: GGDEF domain-containing protein [Deltaproteobacteria bacterium]|nr:GGDEF domain-containing protein [Deltaproteobacteria bacterium]